LLNGTGRKIATEPGIRPRLLVFPFAGGSCLALRPFLSGLASQVDIWGAEYPGRGFRSSEPPVDRVDSLVEEFVDAISRADDFPTLLLGYSFGALVAYEVALRLRSSPTARPVGLIAVSAKAPHFASASLRAHALSDRELIDYLRRLDGTAEEILNNTGMMEQFLPAIRADLRAYETYENAARLPLDCPVVAIHGSADPFVEAAHMLAWRDYVENAAFRSHEVASGHFCHRDAPQELGRLLDSVLTSLMIAPLEPFHA
jgi:surfactin synthase thioesterase subunit